MDYKDFSHITLNNKKYSKHDILEIEITGNTHLDEVFLFLKTWFDKTEEIIVQTSGSTGKPKLISIPKQSFVESAKNTCEYLKLNSKTSALLCIPVKYIGGKMMVIRALFKSYNLYVVEPSANPFTNFNKKIDFIALTPYQAFETGGDNKKELENTDIVIIGGGEINNLFLEVIKFYKNKMYSTFGMTETVSHIALKRISGKELSGNFEVLADYNISKNEENCLMIDCPTLTDKQIVTNDLVEIVTEKEFKWLGRKDNIINSGGIKISPEEIEQKLQPILIGMKFYVSSVLDEKLGNKLVLVVNKSIFLTLDIKLSFINSKLEKHKTIKQIIYVDEFEYTENGKIIRS